MNSAQFNKTIIIDDFHPVLLEKLEAKQIPFHYLPEISKEEAIRAIAAYDIVIVRSKLEFTEDLLATLPRLKCIARGGAGMDNIDEDAARRKGVTLINAPEGNRDAVAEHAIALLLSVSNRIQTANREVKQKIWQREANRGWEIGGKTIGIIGYGNTGRALAQKLAGFGCNIIAYDKYASANDGKAASVGLEELLSTADVISLHIPLTAETNGMVDEVFLGRCKKGAVLINTSRGKTVQQKEVLRALLDERLSAFATDVLENENFRSYDFQEQQVFDQLASMDQVIMTPHVAGWTRESYFKIADVIGSKVLEYTTK